MRVVGGSARGATLLLVPGDGTRPILDRVKTALFDILRPRISGAVMLDLFGGSGSVGIEALSQGAAHCTFIERGHKAVATINDGNAVAPIKNPFGEGTATRLGMATAFAWHGFDHYGQMVEYLRMNGIVPPASR